MPEAIKSGGSIMYLPPSGLGTEDKTIHEMGFMSEHRAKAALALSRRWPQKAGQKGFLSYQAAVPGGTGW